MSNIVKGGMQLPPEILEKVVVGGDLSQLNAAQKLAWYNYRCEQAGLSPVNQPFQYIVLNGRLTLYATKAATDQLRANNNISVQIIYAAQEGEMFRVVARATDAAGRQDEDVAVVKLPPSGSEAHANAIMKAYTKAKRRVTLSICGLGMLDETEIEGFPETRIVSINHETAEIVEEIPVQKQLAQGMKQKEGYGVKLGKELKASRIDTGLFKEYLQSVWAIETLKGNDISETEYRGISEAITKGAEYMREKIELASFKEELNEEPEITE